MSRRIWQMRMLLQYIPLITDKTNATGIFTVLISVSRAIKVQIHCHSRDLGKNWKTVM